MSRSKSFCQANSGCLRRCSAALKSMPQAWPADAASDMCSAMDESVTLFCTAPAIRSALPNFLSEIIGTFVLVFVVGAVFSKAVSASGPASALGPYLVGSLVWGIGLSLGGTTGYAINPARDFGPRLAHAILPIAGKRGADWSYAPIPILGPLAGGALAGFALRLLQI